MNMIEQRLARHKDLIIMAGFVIGALFITDWLPRTVDFFDLGTNIKWVYFGVIVASGVMYFRLYMNRQVVFGEGFQRTIPSRNLSNPQHLQSLRTQRGPMPKRAPPVAPPPPQPMRQPSKEIWDEFGKE